MYGKVPTPRNNPRGLVPPMSHRGRQSASSRRNPGGCADGGVEMESSLVRILLVEDYPADALLVRRQLERDAGEPGRFRIQHCAALREGLDHLGKGEADVLLLDLQLPDSDGIETVVRVREGDASVPIGVFTRAGDQAEARRG